MAFEVFMPRMSTSMTEGELVSFIKNDGEKVTAGEPFIEIMTDKVTREVDAEATGTIKYFIEEGDTVPVGTVIAVILEDGEALPEKFKDYSAT